MILNWNLNLNWTLYPSLSPISFLSLLSAALSVNLKILSGEEEISSIRCLQCMLEHPF